MYFLIDDKNKVLFGWSAKCGCSHIKNIFRFLKDDILYCENNKIHIDSDYNCLPDNLDNYTIIIISKNPYKRIISGFLEKYSEKGQFRNLWKYDKITFTMFVEELLKKDWIMINKHHFTPQTTECFNFEKILKSKCIKFYDIEKIDYTFIENLYKKPIPETILNRKCGHERIKYYNSLDKFVYNLDISEYYFNDVDIKYFYNEDLKNKIYEFYKEDFIFFSSFGINYLETIF